MSDLSPVERAPAPWSRVADCGLRTQHTHCSLPCCRPHPFPPPPINTLPSPNLPPRTPARASGPILWRSLLKNTIYDVLKARPGWQEARDDGAAAAAAAAPAGGGGGGGGGAQQPQQWDFFWADKGWIHHELDKTHLADWQRVNHFPNHFELTRKDMLLKNLKRARRRLERAGRPGDAEREYGFFPRAFALPAEWGVFAEEFRRAPGATWIMKPAGRAQGQGIFLFNRLSQVADWRREQGWRPAAAQAAASGGGADDGAAAVCAAEAGGASQQQAGSAQAAAAASAAAAAAAAVQAAAQAAPETYLAQRYLDAPYLVGGRKFDLRIYALVTSYCPLRVYLHRCTGAAKSRAFWRLVVGPRALPPLPSVA